jgi:hypothetical protein
MRSRDRLLALLLATVVLVGTLWQVLLIVEIVAAVVVAVWLFARG